MRIRPTAAVLSVFTIFIFAACTTQPLMLIEASDEQAAAALNYAQQYASIETEYELGGQDPLTAVPAKIDCSGFIIRCYAYALEGTAFTLPYKDAAVDGLFTKWTAPIHTPRPGDIIFMGETATPTPTHISLYIEEKNHFLYFIDATYKPEQNISGVTVRSYPADDQRFLSFARMLVRTR